MPSRILNKCTTTRDQNLFNYIHHVAPNPISQVSLALEVNGGWTEDCEGYIEGRGHLVFVRDVKVPCCEDTADVACGAASAWVHGGVHFCGLLDGHKG